jgi:hypothetical protein
MAFACCCCLGHPVGNLVALNFRVTGYPLQSQLIAPIRNTLTPPDDGPRDFLSWALVEIEK